MVNGRPLVTGTSEGDQLNRIFRLLGTPTLDQYPGLTDLPDYTADLAKHDPPKSIATLVPSLGEVGVDLFEKMMAYDPGRRITAQNALSHPFFDDMRG